MTSLRIAILFSIVTIIYAQGNCRFPDGWAGEYSNKADFYKFTSTGFTLGDSEFTCLKSKQNQYLMRNTKDNCNQCYEFEQPHSNILEFHESTCSSENPGNQDLESVCAGTNFFSTKLVRKDAVVQCPFHGTRTFIYQTDWNPRDNCPLEHSAIYSSNNDTFLDFRTNPCPKQSDPNIIASSKKFECRATWSDSEKKNVHYIVFKTNQLSGKPETFYCATYEKVEDEDYLYRMRYKESDQCTDLQGRYKYKFQIFDNAVVPGKPRITGYDPAARNDVGTNVTLTCTSRNGFPIANITWFRNDEELERSAAHTKQYPNKVESHLEAPIYDKESKVNYTCKAYNYATIGDNMELLETVTVSYSEGNGGMTFVTSTSLWVVVLLHLFSLFKNLTVMN